MIAIAYILAAMWSIGCLGYAAVSIMVTARYWGAWLWCMGAIFIQFPALALLAWIPWAIISYEVAP